MQRKMHPLRFDRKVRRSEDAVPVVRLRFRRARLVLQHGKRDAAYSEGALFNEAAAALVEGEVHLIDPSDWSDPSDLSDPQYRVTTSCVFSSTRATCVQAACSTGSSGGLGASPIASTFSESAGAAP